MTQPAPIWLTVAYIEDHLTAPLTLADLAQRAAFSPYHYHRLFLAVVGESVMDYIRQRRLTRAAFDLVDQPGRRVLDIAIEYQFNSQEVFTRAFRKAYGVSPGEYRRRRTFLPLLNRADAERGEEGPQRPLRSPGGGGDTMTLFERVHATFLTVSDPERSVCWYTETLGLDVLSDFGIHGADLKVFNDETMLTLIPVPDARPAHVMDFQARDLPAAHATLRSRGADVSEINDVGPLQTFQFWDPDGNTFGVWWEQATSPPPTPDDKLFDRIDRVFLPVKDLDGTAAWYERVLGLTLVEHWDEGADFRVGSGESLLTLIHQEDAQPLGMIHEAAQAPHFNFKVSNVRRCYRWLQRRGVRLSELMENPWILCFNLWDPEGNLLGVCYEKPGSPYYTR